MEKATRAYNTWERDWTVGTITKKSKTDRLRNEIRYYREIPWEFQTLFPRMVNASGWDDKEHWMTLEYYNYLDLGLYMLGQGNHSLVYDDWLMVMTHLRIIIGRWCEARGELGNPEHARMMYIEKTEREQQVFVDQNIASGLFDGDIILINDRPTPTFKAIWPSVKEYIEETIIPTYKVGMIHGDFCFSNMLFGGNVFRFIDPRGSFGEVGIFGDPRYDVAKMYHSVDAGYEFFNNNLFRVTRAKNPSQSWAWDYGKQIIPDQWQDKMNALGAFETEFFEGNDPFNRKEITLIEGLIYIGACARHYENPDRQIAMYLVGLQLLNKALML